MLTRRSPQRSHRRTHHGGRPGGHHREHQGEGHGGGQRLGSLEEPKPPFLAGARAGKKHAAPVLAQYDSTI